MIACPADARLHGASDDDISEAVDLLHAVARGAVRDHVPDLLRPMPGDVALIDAIAALAAG